MSAKWSTRLNPSASRVAGVGTPQEKSMSVKGAAQKRHLSKTGEQKPQCGNFCAHSLIFCAQQAAACQLQPIHGLREPSSHSCTYGGTWHMPSLCWQFCISCQVIVSRPSAFKGKKRFCMEAYGACQACLRVSVNFAMQ